MIIKKESKSHYITQLTQNLRTILLYYIPSTKNLQRFLQLLDSSLQLSLATIEKNIQQPYLGIDYIYLYMEGLLEPSY